MQSEYVKSGIVCCSSLLSTRCKNAIVLTSNKHVDSRFRKTFWHSNISFVISMVWWNCRAASLVILNYWISIQKVIWKVSFF